MTAPVTKGLHHLKLPVSDLDASLAWYARVLGAQHQEKFDHLDERGVRYAVIMMVPGTEVPLELRWASRAARAVNGYDPIDFAAGSADDVAAWAAHLDAEGVEHSPITQGGAGKILVFPDPDGPWVAPPAMQHPGQPGYDDGGGAR